MKRKIFILFAMVLFLVGSVSAAEYYVKSDGNDNLDGLSDATAWETITKVNTVNFGSGDIIQFKRGGTWIDATLTLDSTSVGRSGIIVQDYGTGNKPRIDGNSVRPILINHALVDLTIKNIDISGSDTAGIRCQINHVNGITIDGVDYNGHTGSSSYVRSTAMAVSYHVDGDIEIKNCHIQNVMKDTFANSLSAWGDNDAHGLIMYYTAIKFTGTVDIHDNSIHDVYADCIQLAGLRTTTNVYDNELYNFGENAIDMKHSKNIDFYRNDVSHNDYGEKSGGGWYGPGAIGHGLSDNFDNNLYPAQDNMVRENYIHSTKYIAISMPGKDSIIKNNYIKDCGMGVSISETGAKVYNNVFEITTGKPTVEPYASRWAGVMLSGIRLRYNAKADTCIYNNTFYMSSSDHLYGIAVEADADVTGTIIKNNIINMHRDSSSVFPLYIVDYDNSGNLPTVGYNNFYGTHSNRVRIEETSGNWVTYDSSEQTDWRNAGHTGGLFTDPLFVDAVNGDLHLQLTSPACTASETGSYIGAYPCSLEPSCQSLGHRCCSSCESNPHPEFDADCPGQVCCEVCYVPTSSSLANSDTMIANSNNFALDHPVEHLWDGCLDGTSGCTSGAGNISSFWIEFDFGQNYNLNLTRLFGDSVGNWISTSWTFQYKINLEDSWTTAFSGENALVNDWITQNINLIARYVRVEVFGDQDVPATQARELEIYGTAVSGSSCGDADTNTDGTVDIIEIINYMASWKAGTVSIENLMIGIGEWKNGC